MASVETLQGFWQVRIYDTSGKLVDLPQSDIESITIEDVINGGSGTATIVFSRNFNNIGAIANRYTVLVWFWAPGSTMPADPYYGGHIVDYDQRQLTASGRVTAKIEGDAKLLDAAIVTEKLNPGINGNPNMDAGQYVQHLLSVYQPTNFVAPSIPNPTFNMFPTNFDATKLGAAVDTVLKQGRDLSGNLWTWYVRTRHDLTRQVVVQADQNPNTIAGLRWKMLFLQSQLDQYSIQNLYRDIVNVVAVYGGKDPSTGQQVFGVYQDASSVSQFGPLEDKISVPALSTVAGCQAYATTWLTLHAYPKAQGSARLLVPDPGIVAGTWVQIWETPATSSAPAVIKQVRVATVKVTISRNRIDQVISTQSPVPYLDDAVYRLGQHVQVQQAIANLPVPSNRQALFVRAGGTVSGTASNPAQIALTPCEAVFPGVGVVYAPALALTTLTDNSGGPNQGKSGDGAYTVSLTSSATYVITQGTRPANTSTQQNLVAVTVISGVPWPTDIRTLEGHPTFSTTLAAPSLASGTSVALPTPPNAGSGAYDQPFTFSLDPGAWTSADPSFAYLEIGGVPHGATTAISTYTTMQPTSNGTYTGSVPGLGAGTAYDLYVRGHDNLDRPTPWLFLGTTLQNPISVAPGQTQGASTPNMIADSQFANVTFNSSGSAASDPYWSFELIDGQSSFIGQGSASSGSNYYANRPAMSGKMARAKSYPIAVNPGTSYSLSGYQDARTVTGTIGPTLEIWTYTGNMGSGLTLVTMLAQVAQTIGTNGRTAINGWTCPSGVTSITAVASTNGCTIGSSILVQNELQFEIGSQASDYKGTTGIPQLAGAVGTTSLQSYAASTILSQTPANSLTASTTPGQAIIAGIPVNVSAQAYTYPANSDTYDSVDATGIVSHASVAIDAGVPPPAPNVLRFQKVTTNGSAITAITPMQPLQPGLTELQQAGLDPVRLFLDLIVSRPDQVNQATIAASGYTTGSHTIQYRITAQNADGDGPTSAVFSLSPVNTPSSSAPITLTWAIVPNTVQYTVEHSVDNTAWSILGTALQPSAVGATTAQIVDSGQGGGTFTARPVYDGLIRQAPLGNVDGYFAPMGLRYLVPHLSKQTVINYLNAYTALLHQQDTSTRYIFSGLATTNTPVTGSLGGPAVPDSHDSYAAMFILLVIRYCTYWNDYSWLSAASPYAGQNNLQLLGSIAYTNLATQIKSNGLIQVYQAGYQPAGISAAAAAIGYCEDNCEDYDALNSLAQFLAIPEVSSIPGAPSASYYQSIANSNANGIQNSLWDQTQLAYRNNDTETIGSAMTTAWYPSCITQLFPEFHNVPVPPTSQSAPEILYAQKTQRDRYRYGFEFIQKYYPRWWDIPSDTFPFVMGGYYLALRRGLYDKALSVYNKAAKYNISPGQGNLGTLTAQEIGYCQAIVDIVVDQRKTALNSDDLAGSTVYGDGTFNGRISFNSPPTMSGANVTSGTLPNAALVTPPVVSVSGGTGVSVSGATTTPSVALAHGDYCDLGSAQTITAAKTFSTAPSAPAYGLSTGSLIITSGSGSPTASQPKGSLYLRTDGATGSTLYVSQGGGTWNAVSGV